MIQRERFEEYQKHIYLGRVLATIFGANGAQMARIEEMLELAIFQTAYDPQEIRRQMETARDVARREREERMRDARLLAKTASYSADEEDKSGTFRSALGKKRFVGVEDPWK